MGGGLMQLVAYGAQDVYLTGEPQITFFKVVYRRHTNFAIESIQQTFNGTVGFGKKVSAVISRNGDLVTGMHLEIDITGSDASDCYFTDAVGHVAVTHAEIEIGGQKIDKHYGLWLEIWDELTGAAEKKGGYDRMVGKATGWEAIKGTGATDASGDLVGDQSGGVVRTYYVPLQFWFNRNPGLALPLIALQYHEVKVIVQFAKETDLIVKLDPQGNISGVHDVVATKIEAKLYVDYIYLDTEERRRFAQMSHEYLIDQLQYAGAESVPDGALSKKVRLNFNHPVKELVWVLRSTEAKAWNDHFNFTGREYSDTSGVSFGVDNETALKSAHLLLNGHERFSKRKADYFQYVQPYYHHTRIPSKPVYVYSFGFRPEEHQPSGTCNFSRIDNATLDLTFVENYAGAGEVNVFAVNYNVLRVVSGMGGLAYSN